MRRWLAILALAAAGCGGGASADSCGQVQPCGGDVVGTWKLTSACAVHPPVPDGLCAAATVAHSSYEISGTATFGADLKYSIVANARATLEVTVPGSCLTIGGVTTSCTQLTPQVGSGVNVRCVESGDGCLCTFVQLPRDLGEMGTYTTSGSTLTETPAGGTPSSVGYCVAGDRAHIVTVDPKLTSPTGEPLVIGDVVGSRENP
jgi:hypothetical protein